MFRSSIKLLCLVVLSAAIVTVAFAKGEKLRYQMAKGATHQYTVTSDNKTTAQMQGQDFTTKAWSLFGISMVGDDLSKNGDLVVIAKVDTNISKIDSPMMKDTARVMKDINGKRVRVTLTALGKTVNSENVDPIPPAPASPMGGSINPADFMRRLFLELPEQEVGVGDTWKQMKPDTTNAQGMKIITKPDVVYKIAGTEKMGGYDCVKITYEGTATQYGSGSRQGMELVLDGTVKSSGTAFFAPKEGLLIAIENSSTSDLNISGSGEQMFTATQSTTSVQKVTLVK
jgi:hypothetical protein